MPRQPKPRHFYSVYIACYVSMEVKQRVEREERNVAENEFTMETFYMGTDERTAGIKFYQACKAATANPLVKSVSILRDSQTLIRIPFHGAR
jgi:hypothetical protein